MARYPISICMAGAVSAGAYTAGAMAVLLQALKRWEDEALNLPNRPKHRVVLKGMSSASAGSIQAALSSLEIFSADQSRELGKEAWLSVDLEQLLENSDISSGAYHGNSVLNTQVLRDKTDEVLKGYEWGAEWPAFIDDHYEVRLSVTNLRGVPYNVRLPSTNRVDFGMSRHNEYLHYHFQTDAPSPSPYSTVQVGSDTNKDQELRSLTSAALASSAFPVAFEPIEIVRPMSTSDKDQHDLKPWLKAESAQVHADENTEITYSTEFKSPAWNNKYGTKETFYAVDGGVTNNEPILEAFKILVGDHTSNWSNFPSLDDDEQKNDGRVIMIDPFPNSLDRDVKPTSLRIDKLLNTMRSALIGHARFSEPVMVSNHLRDRVGLVYPSNPCREREGDENRPQEEQMIAIKSGGLGGFSGFLKKNFLEHDYELGKLNMMRFLRYHFTVPVTHPLVNGDQDYINAFSLGSGANKRVPIIPVYEESAPNSFAILNVPDSEKFNFYDQRLNKYNLKFTKEERTQLSKKLKKRVGKVGTNLLNSHNAGWLARQLWNIVLKGKLSSAVVKTIETSLNHQELLDYKIKK